MKSSIYYLLIFFSLVLSNCSHPEKPNKSFTLIGKINGLDTGKIVLRFFPDSNSVFDTARISNGEFIFKGTINEPLNAELDAGNDSNKTSFYIEPAVMKIFLTRNKFSEFKMSGSITQEEYELIDRLGANNYKNRRSLQDASFKNLELINNTNNEETKKQLEKENEELDKQIEQSINNDFKIWLDFIKAHPNSYLSPLYLLMLREREYLTFDSTKSLFNSLDIKVKVSKYGLHTTEFLKIQEKTQIGATAPDFNAIDINDQPISLAQFRGKKVILIEFWASWCHPCRSSFSFLKSLYKKYNSKGFEIIAVSNFDLNKDSWKSAIRQENIENFRHLATIFQRDKPINKDILRDYPLSPIPVSFLIDKSGKIVGSWKGYSPENEKLLDNKLEELLK